MKAHHSLDFYACQQPQAAFAVDAQKHVTYSEARDETEKGVRQKKGSGLNNRGAALRVLCMIESCPLFQHEHDFEVRPCNT